jgi:hypothetical protein
MHFHICLFWGNVFTPGPAELLSLVEIFLSPKLYKSCTASELKHSIVES